MLILYYSLFIPIIFQFFKCDVKQDCDGRLRNRYSVSLSIVN